MGHSSRIIQVVAFVDFIFFFGAALPKLADWRLSASFASFLASSKKFNSYHLGRTENTKHDVIRFT
jgi:hypothetical protein